jgi:hypothetical protein
MNQHPSKFLVRAESNFDDVLTFKSGVKLFRYVKTDPSQFATMIATVSGVPLGHSIKHGQEGYEIPDVREGDTVLVRYDAFTNTKSQPDSDTTRYLNEVYYDGQSEWMVGIDQLMGVRKPYAIVGDDGLLTWSWFWKMFNGYTWVDFVSRIDLNPLSPYNGKHVPWKGKGIVRYTGKPLSTRKSLNLQSGDVIYFDPRMPQVYELSTIDWPEVAKIKDGKADQDRQVFFIIKEQYIYAKVDAESESGITQEGSKREA